MFVSKSMTKNVVTIDTESDLFKAQHKMRQHRIRHLPVLQDERRLVGILTDRDIRSALPHNPFKDSISEEAQKQAAALQVKDIMTKAPFTVSPADTIQDVLLLMQEKKISAFPVVDAQGRLAGIISVRDLLRAFTNVLGIGEPGTLLCIVVEEKIGQLKKIVDAITAQNISLGSVLVAKYWQKNKRAVFPYLLTQNIGPVKKKLKALGFTLLDPLDWTLEHEDTDG